MLPFSVRGCRRAAGLVFGIEMVLDRFWLSRDGVNRDGMAAMLIVLASVGWRQSLARFYVIGSNTPAEILELASGDIIRTGYTFPTSSAILAIADSRSLRFVMAQGSRER